MLEKQMEKALNAQINAELGSAYVYLAMAAYFEAQDLPGFASWMRIQAQEELGHAMKFYGYIHERNGRVILKAIDAPESEWASPLAAFGNAYEHEQKITGMIHKLVDLAIKESDHATNNFLQWFVKEQVEEESNAFTVVRALQRVGDSAQGLFMLDRELGRRSAEG